MPPNRTEWITLCVGRQLTAELFYLAAWIEQSDSDAWASSRKQNPLSQKEKHVNTTKLKTRQFSSA